jgi:hypothetical protein
VWRLLARRVALLAAVVALVAAAGCGPKAGASSGDSVAKLDEADAAARGYVESVPEISDEIGKPRMTLVKPGGVFSAKTDEGDALVLTYKLTGGDGGGGKANVWLLHGDVAWTAVGVRARVHGKTVRAGRELDLAGFDPDHGLD